jgi:Uma2 family endonuclease
MRPITAEQMAQLMPDASQLLSDEPEMESTLHWNQLEFLAKTLRWHWCGREDFFIGANLTIYFSRLQLKNRDFRGPDFFLVLDTDPRPRASWVVWEEGGKYPDLIIELLSDSTADVDREIKRELYQDHFRTPEYFLFSPVTMEFIGYRLQGRKYAEIPSNEQGWKWSETLNLYLGVEDGRLRYFTPDGGKVLTPEEDAAQEKLRVEEERQRAEQERLRAERAEEEAALARRRAEKLAARLRELGLDPSDL